MRVEEVRADYLATLVDHQGWLEMTIDEIADVNPRADKASIPDDLPVSFIPMRAVGAGDGSIQVEETRPAGEVKKGFTAFLEGDVLFAKITPCMENGKMVVVPKLVNDYGFGSTEFHVLRPKPGIDAKYLYYYVSSQTFRSEAERHMTGAVGQRRVSTTYLKECKIPIAPLDQQKRIVAEIEKQFSRLDQAVANLKRVKANLKRYKTAVLKAAVEGRLVETEAELAHRASVEAASRRLDQRQGKGKYKEPVAPDTTNLPKLPEGWVWANIDQLAEVGTGATPKRGQSRYYGGDIPWVTSAVVNDAFVDRATEFVTNEALTETNLTLYPPGTLLVAMYGEGKTRGKCTELRISATTNQALAALQVDEYVRTYLKLFLDYNYEETRKVASGGVQPNLNLSLVRAIRIPFPPLTEQHRIVAEVDRRLSLLRETEVQVDVNLKRAERLRQSVLNNAFSCNSKAFSYIGAHTYGK